MKNRIISILTLVLCTVAALAQSPCISRVYDFSPAPGQFINENYPAIYPGDTRETVLARVDSILKGDVEGDPYFAGKLISLGAWGGSVTFGFDHDIINLSGERDFVVLGNAFYSGQPKNGYRISSSEPGIIWVSADQNGNGLPDDEWYEIAGSESARTTRQYSCTYYPSNGDILWEDSEGNAGYVHRNDFHLQDSYFPAWITDDELTLTGSILPPNFCEESGNRSYSFDFGYADNHPNDSVAAGIDISWAITADGEPARLNAIRFVKVQTGVQVDWGVSGEMSTEVSGARDLHPDATALDAARAQKARKIIRNGQVFILHGGELFDVLGKKVKMP